MAFGLSIVAMAYCIGTVSGCHVNPAVSIAMFVNKRITATELGFYVMGQIVGALLGSLVLYAFLSMSDLPLTNFGQNSFGALGAGGALLAEFILTFVFVLVIIVVTGKKGNANLAGLVIGFTLVLIHLLGIPLTGTSVNPARSLGPALFAGGEALSQLWVFIVAPLAGGIVAAIVGKFVFDTEDGNESIANKRVLKKTETLCHLKLARHSVYLLFTWLHFLSSFRIVNDSKSVLSTVFSIRSGFKSFFSKVI